MNEILIGIVLMVIIVALTIKLGVMAINGGFREQFRFLLASIALSYSIFIVSTSEVGESDEYINEQKERTEQVQEQVVRP